MDEATALPTLSWGSLTLGRQVLRRTASPALTDGLRTAMPARDVPPRGAGVRLPALPCSFSLLMSYDTLTLDLQNLGSDMFLLQVLPELWDSWPGPPAAPRQVLWPLRDPGQLPGHGGLSILANVLVPRGNQGSGRRQGGRCQPPGSSLPCPLAPTLVGLLSEFCPPVAPLQPLPDHLRNPV